MRPIIRLAVLAIGLAIVAGAGCNINPTSSGQTASGARRQVTELPTSGPSSGSVWVLSPVGLNLRSAPDPNSSRITTLAQSATLTVSEKQAVGADTWLHVKTASGTEGWVLDKPDLIIHRAVSLHVEQSSGYSILFPADWSPVSGNPAVFTGTSGPGGGSLTIQTADDRSKLAATPSAPGQELRQESPIEVYGQTTYLTIYKLDAGGFEYAVKMQFPKTKVAYLLDFRQPGGNIPDTTLFKQLLGSMIVPGEG